MFSGLPSCCQLCYWAWLSGCCSNIRICQQQTHNGDVPSGWLPARQVIGESPSCRFASERQRPCGSFERGMPAEVMARAGNQVIQAFQGMLPGWSTPGPLTDETMKTTCIDINYYYYYCCCCWFYFCPKEERTEGLRQKLKTNGALARVPSQSRDHQRTHRWKLSCNVGSQQEKCFANISIQLVHSAVDPLLQDNQVQMNPTGPESGAQLTGKEDSVEDRNTSPSSVRQQLSKFCGTAGSDGLKHGNKSRQVCADVKGLPSCQGIKVSLLRRLPSTLVGPVGSL